MHNENTKAVIGERGRSVGMSATVQGILSNRITYDTEANAHWSLASYAPWQWISPKITLAPFPRYSIVAQSPQSKLTTEEQQNGG